jgi:hypothetical protein
MFTHLKRYSNQDGIKCHERTTERRQTHISTFHLTSPLGGVGGQSRAAGILLPEKIPGTR